MTSTVFYPLKAPVRRKRKAPPAAPPAPPVAGNAIVAVVPGALAGTVVVTLGNPLVGYDDVEKMLGVSADGGETYYFPVAIDDADPLNVVFTFADDVSDATTWYVPGSSNYHFADGEPMVPPFSGAIG